MLHKIAVSEKPEKKSSNLSEEVRRTLLDDTFWHESKAIVNLLKPLQSAITQLEEDSPNLADVCRLLTSNIVSLLRKKPKSIFALFEKNAKNINDAASNIENSFLFPSFNLLVIFHQLKLNFSSNLLVAVLQTFDNHMRLFYNNTVIFYNL